MYVSKMERDSNDKALLKQRCREEASGIMPFSFARITLLALVLHVILIACHYHPNNPIWREEEKAPGSEAGSGV